MKKLLSFYAFFFVTVAFAQFNINIEAPKDFSPKEAYLYTLNGSRDILSNKTIKKINVFSFRVEKPYFGMLKVYFPENNTFINFVSENKNVHFNFQTLDNKISKVNYTDETNLVMDRMQKFQRKKEEILPALQQMKDYYDTQYEFRQAIDKEITELTAEQQVDAARFPFVSYYTTNYRKYLQNPAGVTNAEISNFLTNTGSYLEHSSLLKPLLLAYLNNAGAQQLDQEVETLLKNTNVETNRGQTILSEIIDIFDLYGLTAQKDKYLAQAQDLKCEINSHLTTTLTVNENMAIGKKFPDNTFKKPINTKAKTLHGVSADKKIVMFWASTCPHCDKEISQMLEKYSQLKKRNIEIIGLSVDSDAKSYQSKANILPWINDSELMGWYSSYVDKYNVHATPQLFILDSQNYIIYKPANFADAMMYLKIQ